MASIELLKAYTAYELSDSDLADCLTPDTLGSPGAQFLVDVRNDVLEAWEEGRFKGDDDRAVIHEIADDAPDFRTHQLWQQFVDLGGYQEEPQDEWPKDLNQTAGLALYYIAERLAQRLLDELRESAEDDAEDEVECCPACGDPIDYCQGHGDIGDPQGAATLLAHDNGVHFTCHPDGCEDAPRRPVPVKVINNHHNELDDWCPWSHVEMTNDYSDSRCPAGCTTSRVDDKI